MRKYPLGTLLSSGNRMYCVVGYYNKVYISHMLWSPKFGFCGYWSDYYMKQFKVLFVPK